MGKEEVDVRTDELYHLGYINKLRGENDLARTFFLEVLELDPQHAKAKAELQ